MAGLNAPTAPIFGKSTGNTRSDSQRVRALGGQLGDIVATAQESHQTQLDNLVTAGQQAGAVTDIAITNANGAVIGWIGNRVIGGVSYFGAWFKSVYLGGADASSAAIVIGPTGVLTSLTITGDLTCVNAFLSGDLHAANVLATGGTISAANIVAATLLSSLGDATITGMVISGGSMASGSDITATGNVRAVVDVIADGQLNCSALSDVGGAVVTLQGQVATLIAQMATAGKAGVYPVVAGNVTVPLV